LAPLNSKKKHQTTINAITDKIIANTINSFFLKTKKSL